MALHCLMDWMAIYHVVPCENETMSLTLCLSNPAKEHISSCMQVQHAPNTYLAWF